MARRALPIAMLAFALPAAAHAITAEQLARCERVWQAGQTSAYAPLLEEQLARPEIRAILDAAAADQRCMMPIGVMDRFRDAGLSDSEAKTLAKSLLATKYVLDSRIWTVWAYDNCACPRRQLQD